MDRGGKGGGEAHWDTHTMAAICSVSSIIPYSDSLRRCVGSGGGGGGNEYVIEYVIVVARKYSYNVEETRWGL